MAKKCSKRKSIQNTKTRQWKLCLFENNAVLILSFQCLIFTSSQVKHQNICWISFLIRQRQIAWLLFSSIWTWGRRGSRIITRDSVIATLASGSGSTSVLVWIDKRFLDIRRRYRRRRCFNGFWRNKDFVGFERFRVWILTSSFWERRRETVVHRWRRLWRFCFTCIGVAGDYC